MEEPGLFYSFGSWGSLEDIRRMRTDPRTPEMIGKLTALCEEAKPGFAPQLGHSTLSAPNLSVCSPAIFVNPPTLPIFQQSFDEL